MSLATGKGGGSEVEAFTTKIVKLK
jgi:hypothetical protein